MGSLKLPSILLALLIAGLNISASPLNEVATLIRIMETDTSLYFLSDQPTDSASAQNICSKNSAQLISIESDKEFRHLLKTFQKDLSKSLSGQSLWTSGISFSNSTVENLLIWTGTNSTITYKQFYDESQISGNSSGALKALDRIVRNKRSSSKDDCNCDCTSTPPPFIYPPCKIPNCNIQFQDGPICKDIRAPTCEIEGTPECDITDRDCSVDCGKCIVVQQPVCTVKDSARPRCRLEVPKCEQGETTCTITYPENEPCTAVQDKCTKEDSSCNPIIKPCKKSCASEECTTVTPPCTTAPPTCHTTCKPPDSSLCKLERRCRQKRGSEEELSCEMIPVCPEPECQTTCPPAKVTCPPPVTSCSRPFVDCSPDVCQSLVQICMPPKIRCPPPRISCPPPIVNCDVKCTTEPEVICDLPEVDCTKPKVVCPDALVNCKPIIHHCQPPKLRCGHPEAIGCKSPRITCGEAVECPGGPVERPVGSGCGGCSGKCSRNTANQSTELVENKRCVAMSVDHNLKWELQSCNLKKKFVCEMKKKKGDDVDFYKNLVG